MKSPFRIFPSIGYKNTQFQIVASVDDLKIDIYDQNVIVASIEANSKNPTILTKINATGKLIAKCVLNNTVFQQDLEVKEAFRLGSSEFKKAFVFDDTDYSFFLMKDRLLIYDEQKQLLLTENHYSPTEILKIDNTNFLFVTKIGQAKSGIVNLGVYNTESFTFVGEILNDYREIKIMPEGNKVWLLNLKYNSIHCYELISHDNKYLTELKSFEKFNDYYLDEENQLMYINHNEVLRVISLNNLHETIEIPKNDNNAIDLFGNVITLENGRLICTKIFTSYSEVLNLDFAINLEAEAYIHIGSQLCYETKLKDLDIKIASLKEAVISSLPNDEIYKHHLVPQSEYITEFITTHRIYPTINGVYLIQNKFKREFRGIRVYKEENGFKVKPDIYKGNELNVKFFNSDKAETLIESDWYLRFGKYHNGMIYLRSEGDKVLLSGRDSRTLEYYEWIDIFTVNEIDYFLIESKGRWSLYRSTNLNNPLLEQIEILNRNLFKTHQIIYYRGNEKNGDDLRYLNAFDLKNCTRIFLDEKKVQHSLFKDASDFKFFETYAMSSNQIVFNPETLEVKDAFVGIIESHSKQLNKIVSHRLNKIYLSVFNPSIGKYELLEITFDEKKFRESYLSPNGEFLVLQEKSDEYMYYDIGKGEIIKFFSGNFLAFRNDGSLIVEENDTKAVKIYDPQTFQDITPPNYHHYRFMSPDGKLYAQVASKVKYYHKLTGQEIGVDEVIKIRKELDLLPDYPNADELEKAKNKIANNRKVIYDSFKKQFEELGIKDYNSINSRSVVKVDKFVEIGITGTNIFTEVHFPEDIKFYNYSAFSYDNKYFGYVGKPNSKGLIHLFRINFDEVNSKLMVVDSYLSYFPKLASWVCGFSRKGYFATYDSTPDTYLIKMDDSFFSELTTDTDLNENIFKNERKNIYHNHKNWNIIQDKNFLCFSPSGNFLALSEQGYEPLTLGGYGHQESNVVHIAKTETGEIIDSFTGHGDKINDDRSKKVTFVAFSEDESKIMTLSSDGVVFVRNLNLNDNANDIKVSSANKSSEVGAVSGEMVS